MSLDRLKPVHKEAVSRVLAVLSKAKLGGLGAQIYVLVRIKVKREVEVH